MSRSRALSLLYAAPFLLLVLWLLGPVIVGGETLFMRDVMNTHLEMKAFQAEAMRSGALPLVDPPRSGGQPPDSGVTTSRRWSSKSGMAVSSSSR